MSRSPRPHHHCAAAAFLLLPQEPPAFRRANFNPLCSQVCSPTVKLPYGSRPLRQEQRREGLMIISHTFPHCCLTNILQYDYFFLHGLNFKEKMSFPYITTGMSVVVVTHILLVRGLSRTQPGYWCVPGKTISQLRSDPPCLTHLSRCWQASRRADRF